MMFFKNMKIGTKLMIFMVIMELLIVGVAYHGITVARENDETYKDIMANDVYASMNAYEMGMHFQHARANMLLALRSEGWSAGLGKDLAAHLTLTHMLFYRSYLFTSLGSVTWTVGVLAGFYLLFPLLARAFWRWPLGCLAALCAGQLAYSWGFALKCSGAAYQMAFNQLPAFLGVWAMGMAGAELYEALCRYAARLPFRAAALAVGLAALWCVFQMQKDLAYAPNGQRWQLVHRLPLALLQCIALLGLCLGPQLPGRRLWQWLAAISYNFYLWHQSLAVWLKYRWHLPPWAGDTPPNQLGDANWQQAYNLLCWGTALLVSALMTRYAEQPAAAWLKRRLFAQKD